MGNNKSICCLANSSNQPKQAAKRTKIRAKNDKSGEECSPIGQKEGERLNRPRGQSRVENWGIDLKNECRPHPSAELRVYSLSSKKRNIISARKPQNNNLNKLELKDIFGPKTQVLMTNKSTQVSSEASSTTNSSQTPPKVLKSVSCQTDDSLMLGYLQEQKTKFQEMLSGFQELLDMKKSTEARKSKNTVPESKNYNIVSPKFSNDSEDRGLRPRYQSNAVSIHNLAANFKKKNSMFFSNFSQLHKKTVQSSNQHILR